MKNKIKIILFVILIIISLKTINALSVPHGISGFVYDLNGITQVPEGTRFSVHDLTSNQYIEGQTGRGFNTGKYAVSIDGEDGDIVLIRVWNPQHESNLTITLNGVMSNVNLFLNITVEQPLPPKLYKFPGNITVRNQTISIHKIPQPYIIHSFFNKLNQIPRFQNISIVIINTRTGKTINFTIGTYNFTIGSYQPPDHFYTIISGSKDDDIILKIDNQEFRYKLGDKSLQDLKFMKTKRNGYIRYNNKVDYLIKRVLNIF